MDVQQGKHEFIDSNVFTTREREKRCPSLADGVCKSCGFGSSFPIEGVGYCQSSGGLRGPWCVVFLLLWQLYANTVRWSVHLTNYLGRVHLPTSTSALMSEPRAPVAPSCVAKIGCEEIVKKVYETIQVGKGKTRARL